MVGQAWIIPLLFQDLSIAEAEEVRRTKTEGVRFVVLPKLGSFIITAAAILDTVSCGDLQHS